MCMHVTKETHQEAEQLRKLRKKLIGYKVMKRGTVCLYSDVYNKRWRPNKTGVYRSNRTGTKLGSTEKPRQDNYIGLTLGIVNRGFHFYRYLTGARYSATTSKVIVKFEINPEDLITAGRPPWNLRKNMGQLVATKAKMVGILPITKGGCLPIGLKKRYNVK